MRKTAVKRSVLVDISFSSPDVHKFISFSSVPWLTIVFVSLCSFRVFIVYAIKDLLAYLLTYSIDWLADWLITDATTVHRSRTTNKMIQQPYNILYTYTINQSINQSVSPHLLIATFYRCMLYSNGAVLSSYDVRLSVRPSVTLMDADHIRWARWNQSINQSNS